jgi:hypothetical protein
VATEPEAAPPSEASEYLPSISDLMIAAIQPRHDRTSASDKKIDSAPRN